MNPPKLSEIIAALSKIKEEKGDLEILIGRYCPNVDGEYIAREFKVEDRGDSFYAGYFGAKGDEVVSPIWDFA